MNKTTQIYGIRAIIEAINNDEPIDKVFLQKGLRGDLYRELESLLRKKGINNSYVPIEKLHRLTKNNHQGAVANISPIRFFALETLVESVLESKQTCRMCWSFRNYNSKKRCCPCHSRYH